MNLQKFNWQIWAGFLLNIVAFLSYPFFFVNWPVTRDFPWGSLLLFAIAAVLLFVGLRRAFAPDCALKSKIAGGVLATLSALVLVFFVIIAFIVPRQLPASTGAPHVGQKAPDFTLADTNNNPVSLSSLLSTPIEGKAPKGALLIFYRGYW
jgi:hypothetical protein